MLLRATGATIYRVYLNGQFLAHGPARGPHGFFRVDEWDITDKLQPGVNTVAFEVAGYNVNSYYLLDQPSFLQAEVVAGDKVLASTGGDGERFTASILTERVQKVQRYSFQRPFSEVYRLAPGYDRWRADAASRSREAKTCPGSRRSPPAPPRPLSRLYPPPAHSPRGPGHASTHRHQGRASVERPLPDRYRPQARRLPGE